MEPKLILIADDDPVQRKLLKTRLGHMGFQVAAAKDGADALEQARRRPPDAIVSDVLMPRLDGFMLCKTVRQEPKLMGVPVILTSSGDINQTTRNLAQSLGANSIVRRTPSLDEVMEALKSSLSEKPPIIPVARQELFTELRDQFLAEGQEQSRKLLESLTSALDAGSIKPVAHRWSGVGGTLGFPQISQRAYEIEMLLEKPAPKVEQKLHAALEEIATLFSDAARTPPAPSPVPTEIAQSLSGKRVALVGFEPAEAERVSNALDAVQAFSRQIDSLKAASEPELLRPFDMVILRLGLGEDSEFKLDHLASCHKPLLVIGERTRLLKQGGTFPQCIHDLLITPWRSEELVMRARRVISQATQQASPRDSRATGERTRVIIADDDPTITTLVKATLQNYDMDCHIAHNGGEAIEMARNLSPDALILDVNMPHYDGFQVLASVRNNAGSPHAAVILLTARQQESDIVRGFRLGADDYIVKPFSPIELAMRLKRLLRRTF